ncbi:MAG: hypothetical protein RJR35_01660 [Thermoanaerobacterales bacterium]|nr:hypothetical protein [Thermoanaerobacterales bacterium]
MAYTVVTLLESILGTAAKTAQLISVGGGVGAGILVYFLLSYLMRLEEFQLVLDLIKRRLGMKRKASTIR